MEVLKTRSQVSPNGQAPNQPPKEPTRPLSFIVQGPSVHLVNTVTPSAHGSLGGTGIGMRLGWGTGSICTGLQEELLTTKPPLLVPVMDLAPPTGKDMAGGVEGLSIP